MIRLTTAGALDTSFASGTGKSYPNVVNGPDECERFVTNLIPLHRDTRCSKELEGAEDIEVDASGKLVVVGWTDSDPDPSYSSADQEIDFAMVRLTSTGALDTSFSSDGKTTTALAANSTPTNDGDQAMAMSLQADGKILAAGFSDSSANNEDIAIVRYLTSGSLDTSFDGAGSGNGKLLLNVKGPNSTPEFGNGLALLPNGNAVIGGQGQTGPSYAALAVLRTDGVAPITSILTGPTEGSTILTNSPSFTFLSAGEPSATFECAFEPPIHTAFIPCGSPYVKALPDGLHTLQVRARDAAGNVDATPATRSFTVDADPPVTNLLTDPGTYITDTTPSFTFSSTPGGGSFECAIADGINLVDIDPGEFGACSGAGTHTSAVLPDGEYTFAARASNGGGTDPTPAKFEFEIDNDAPDGQILQGPLGLSSDNTPTFRVSTDEPDDIPQSEFDLSCNLSGAQTTSFPCTGAPFSFPGNLPDGAYTLTLEVEDLLLRQDATPATLAFTIDTG